MEEGRSRDMLDVAHIEKLVAFIEGSIMNVAIWGAVTHDRVPLRPPVNGSAPIPMILFAMTYD